jgi:hypothetical protein
MNPLIEPIERALASDADAESKRAGALACRTILAALEAESGKPISVPETLATVPSPLAGLKTDQLLDLLVTRLRGLVEERGASAAINAGAPLRIPMIVLPPGR